MNIVLIGYRGTGKSAVSSRLAELTGMRRVSTDEDIVRRSGCPIRAYVEAHGWQAFRDLEAEAIADLAREDRLVLDTGGGVVLREANVDALRDHGVLFWLRAGVSTIRDRIASDTERPSLTGQRSFLEEVAEVLAEREPKYASASHYVIDTDSRTVEAIADEILGLYRRHIGPERE